VKGIVPLYSGHDLVFVAELLSSYQDHIQGIQMCDQMHGELTIFSSLLELRELS